MLFSKKLPKQLLEFKGPFVYQTAQICFQKYFDKFEKA